MSKKKYYKSMKYNTKSSITLPREELKLVEELKRRLGAKSNVEVIRRGLQKLKETTDRELLRQAYAKAAQSLKKNTQKELQELDHLASENIE